MYQVFYQSSVAPVRQRSDDQAWGVSQVLVGVFYVTIYDVNTNIVIAPVVTELGEPLEVRFV